MLEKQDESRVRQIVSEILSSGIVQKKIGDTPLEAFDLVNKKYVDTKAGGIDGRSHNPTLTSVANSAVSDLGFQTNDFSNGITWGTTAGGHSGFTVTVPGRYLVHLQVMFGTEPSQPSATEQAFIKKNGTIVSQGHCDAYGAGSENETAQTTDILNCVATDYIEFFAGHFNSSGSVSIINDTAKTYAIIAKV